MHGVFHILRSQQEGSEEDLLVELDHGQVLEKIQKDRDRTFPAEVLRGEIEQRGDGMSCDESVRIGIVEKAMACS